LPKEIWKIDKFHGGLNSNSDPRDIADNELSDATDIMVDELGRIRTMGGTATHSTIDANVAAINPGYGLFQFSSDRLEAETVGATAAKTGDNYLAMADTDGAANIDIWSQSTDNWGAAKIDLGTVTGMKPCFYYVDGALRVSDGSFAANDNQWFGYVYSKLYQTTAGAEEHLIDQWISTDQELKSLDDLSVALVLDDCRGENPNTASVTGSNRIVIGWWPGDDGTWNGQYYIGIAPVYIGNQEGPISIPDEGVADGGSPATHNGTIMLNNEKLNLQLFICQSTSATVADNAAHLLFDSRIIGLKLYVRPYSSEKWYLMKNIDLLQGGKHGWADYSTLSIATGFLAGTTYARFNNDTPGSSEITMTKSGVSTVDGITNDAGGHVDGTYTNVELSGGTGSGAKATIVITSTTMDSVTITTAGSGYTENDELGIPTSIIGGTGSPHCDVNAIVYLQEYNLCTAHFEIDLGSTGIGTNSDGTNRTGALRINGFHNSPLYVEIDLNDATQQTFSISNAMLPSNGDTTFTFDILDEQFNSLFNSTQILKVAVYVGATVPVEQAELEYGGS
jgi:hypothetical protein